jgi:SAM-dependent methyltransferase
MREAVGTMAAGQLKTGGALVNLREHGDVIVDDLRIVRDRGLQGCRILDVGAGRGSFVAEARHRGFDACGLDIDARAPAIWRESGVPGVVGDGALTPFVAASFDVVRMKEVIEHVQDPLALVLEARRLLRPGGLLIAHVPSQYSQFYPIANFWDDYTHVRPFSRFALTRLIADGGLRLEHVSGYTSGRNAAERIFGQLLGRVVPHVYRVVATSPSRDGV